MSKPYLKPIGANLLANLAALLLGAPIFLVTIWIPLMLVVCLVTGRISWRHLLWPFGL